MPAPETRIESFNENGEVRIVFNQDMFIEEPFGGYNFKSKSDYENFDEDSE